MERNYYPHSLTLRCDPKIRALDAEFGGRNGYLHWALLLEQFYDNGKRALDLSHQFMLEAIAAEHAMTADELCDFLDSCALYGLIDPPLWTEKRQVSNANAVEHMETLERQYQQRIAASQAAAEKRRRKDGTER